MIPASTRPWIAQSRNQLANIYDPILSLVAPFYNSDDHVVLCPHGDWQAITFSQLLLISSNQSSPYVHLVQVSSSGRTMSIIGTNTLAGSCSTLLDRFHSLVNIFGVPIGKAMAMLSENTAR